MNGPNFDRVLWAEACKLAGTSGAGSPSVTCPCQTCKQYYALLERDLKRPQAGEPLPDWMTAEEARAEVEKASAAAVPFFEQQPVLPLDAAARNDYPMFDGLFGYFGSALAEVARLSKIANDQHNPGEPMYWSRWKSTDHKNKIVKHLLDAELVDTDGTLHATKLAWRALALLQEILERRGAPIPPNVRFLTNPV